MKNPFVIYNRKRGMKTIREWPVYTLFGLLFLLSLLWIFSLPSGAEVKLEEPLPSLPSAAEGKNFDTKLDLYSSLKTDPSSSFSSRLSYLFSENDDSSLTSFIDSVSSNKDEYPKAEEMLIKDDSWTRSHKAQLELESSVEHFSSYSNDALPDNLEEEDDLNRSSDEEISALKALLKQREDDLNMLISSLEKQQEVKENSNDIVNFSDDSGLPHKSDPLKTKSSDTSVKAVFRPLGVVSGLGLESSVMDESARVIPVQTPSLQRIYVGELLEVRLMDDVSLMDGTVLEKNTRLFASTSLQGDRLLASFENVVKDGRLIPLHLQAYSTRNGLKGIEIENALKDNAVSDITERLSNTTSSSAIRLISNATSALGSVAEDGLRSIIQGGASYLSRKAERKRVVIPSHLEMFLR